MVLLTAAPADACCGCARLHPAPAPTRSHRALPQGPPHLRAAATVAPEDPIHLFTYAQTLLAIEGESRAAEGDGIFQRALQLAPVGELAEKIKAQQRQLAARVMRANAKGEPRRDAVTYLSGALEAYLALDLEAQKQLLAEVAAIAQKGMAINDPQQSLHLRFYRGGSTVSALQAACILYAGVQLLLPGEDAGIDPGSEYEIARGLVGVETELNPETMQIVHKKRSHDPGS